MRTESSAASNSTKAKHSFTGVERECLDFTFLSWGRGQRWQWGWRDVWWTRGIMSIMAAMTTKLLWYRHTGSERWRKSRMGQNGTALKKMAFECEYRIMRIIVPISSTSIPQASDLPNSAFLCYTVGTAAWMRAAQGQFSLTYLTYSHTHTRRFKRLFVDA